MNMIVAADQNWGIGRQGELLVRIPLDLQLFQRETMGKVIVMGRKTLATLPGQMPLAGRRNIILSSDQGFQVRGAETVHSLEEALQLLEECPSEDIYIIGGESVYRQFLPYCDTVHVTKIEYTYDADAHFPNLDQEEDWILEEESEEQTYFDLEYFFKKYRRKA